MLCLSVQKDTFVVCSDWLYVCVCGGGGGGRRGERGVGKEEGREERREEGEGGGGEGRGERREGEEGEGGGRRKRKRAMLCAIHCRGTVLLGCGFLICLAVMSTLSSIHC